MAFMEPEVTEKEEWVEVETNAGGWMVPFDVLSKSEAESARRGDFEPLLKYTEGTRVYNDQSRIKKGYGVRLSAPGYMDATEWEVYGSKKETLRRARELVAEGESDHATKKGRLQRHHAAKKSMKKTSTAQLDREIAESLGSSTAARTLKGYKLKLHQGSGGEWWIWRTTLDGDITNTIGPYRTQKAADAARVHLLTSSGAWDTRVR